MMKDFFGNDLWIGDIVAYIEPRYRTFQRGKVRKFLGNSLLVIKDNGVLLRFLPDMVVKHIEDNKT